MLTVRLTEKNQVWTSTRKKARQTAAPFAAEGIPVREHSVLIQLNPGEADGLTPEQLKVRCGLNIID